MSNKVKKPDPFCDSVLGEFSPDKKNTDKDNYAFSRSGSLLIAEEYAQPWIDPVTFEKKMIFGNVDLKEVRLISKKDGSASYTRHIDPSLKGGKIKNII